MDINGLYKPSQMVGLLGLLAYRLTHSCWSIATRHLDKPWRSRLYNPARRTRLWNPTAQLTPLFLGWLEGSPARNHACYHKYRTFILIITPKFGWEWLYLKYIAVTWPWRFWYPPILLVVASLPIIPKFIENNHVWSIPMHLNRLKSQFWLDQSQCSLSKSQDLPVDFPQETHPVNRSPLFFSHRQHPGTSCCRRLE